MDCMQGGCLCGDVRFRATPPSLWVAHCHCTLCRRAHGAAFVTWVGVDAGQCTIDDARQRLCWYASSPGAERGFCSHCGSMLFFRSERWAGELHIARAQIEGDVDRAPQAHVFWDTHVDWVRLDDQDELPRKSEPTAAG